ncbi:IS3 family transposase [Leptospira kobayashii]|uniref:IS3 family transposase n=1 Tax=Leptospira kobayashii TaxID=1917830 RepID=UPI000D5A0613
MLQRNFITTKPGEAWCSDFTYIQINSKYYFLVVIIDLFNREIISWELSENQQTPTLIKCFENAVKRNLQQEGCIFHSDRGSQYASNEFRRALRLAKMKQSMSRSGNCWDNAVAESFFKTLKVEFANEQKFWSLDDARSKLFYFIEIFYNRKRIHSRLGFTGTVSYNESLMTLFLS